MRNQNKQRTQPFSSKVPEKDRVKTAVIALAANKDLKDNDPTGTRGTDDTVKQKKIEKIINKWPKLSKEVAKTMVKFYRQPNEATKSQLIWYDNGPWKRTVVHKDGYRHDFPEPHVDVLEQVIDYHVPAERVGDVGLLEGSLVVDRTKGEVTVHCDNEGANTLSLNMMHDVVTGKRTPEEARQFITKELPNYLMGHKAPYAEKFQFVLPKKEQGDFDKTTVSGKDLAQLIKKAEEEFRSINK